MYESRQIRRALRKLGFRYRTGTGGQDPRSGVLAHLVIEPGLDAGEENR